MFSEPVVRSAQTVHLSCIISNELTQASTWASSPRSTIGCVQNDFWAYGMFGTNRAPILHRHQQYLQMDQNEILHDPCHLGVPSGASKTISKPLVCSVQTTHLSCVKISTISNEMNQASTWASSPRSTIGCVQNDFWAYGMFSTNHAPILNQHQHYLQIDQNAIPHDPRHLGLPSGASKMIFETMVRLAQTIHHLVSRLALSPNELSQASTWTSSPWSTIRWVQNNFWACGTFGANHATILHQVWHYLQSDWIELPLEPRHLGVPSGVSKMISVPTLCLAQTVHLSCTDTNTIFKWTKTRFHMTQWPWSSIRCVQNDFWGCGMFGTNRAPISHQH
jgi:hypothetical protein